VTICYANHACTKPEYEQAISQIDTKAAERGNQRNLRTLNGPVLVINSMISAAGIS
jgi:hypothetical protein